MRRPWRRPTCTGPATVSPSASSSSPTRPPTGLEATWCDRRGSTSAWCSGERTRLQSVVLLHSFLSVLFRIFDFSWLKMHPNAWVQHNPMWGWWTLPPLMKTTIKRFTEGNKKQPCGEPVEVERDWQICYITLFSVSGSSQPSSPAAQPSAEPPPTHRTTPRPRFQQLASSSCWTECLRSASTATKEINGYERACDAAHWHAECIKRIDPGGIQILISYSFIVGRINFTSVMKERGRKEEEMKEVLLFWTSKRSKNFPITEAHIVLLEM